MNYYERHIGDWVKDTVELSMTEDGAYNRLTDQAYQRETPLPADKREVYRLARANTAAERKAVDYVLGRYFELSDTGWTQKRIRVEIERFHDKQRKARASANARWAKSDGNADADANASPPPMRTHSEGNALQTPDTRHQPPNPADSSGSPAAPPARRALRKAPGSFEVTAEMVEWAAANCPAISPDLLQRETDKFRDHTFTNPKTDWPSTWRNWMRRVAEKLAEAAAPRAGAPRLDGRTQHRNDRMAEALGPDNPVLAGNGHANGARQPFDLELEPDHGRHGQPALPRR